jgi:hypothetical protein
MNFTKEKSLKYHCHPYYYHTMNLRETRGRREGNNKTDHRKLKMRKGEENETVAGAGGFCS